MIMYPCHIINQINILCMELSIMIKFNFVNISDMSNLTLHCFYILDWHEALVFMGHPYHRLRRLGSHSHSLLGSAIQHVYPAMFAISLLVAACSFSFEF